MARSCFWLRPPAPMSPVRSSRSMAATALRRFDPVRLARFLAAATSARSVGVGAPKLLAGGAIQQSWGFRAGFVGGPLDGEHDLVLRADAPTGVPSSLSRI